MPFSWKNKTTRNRFSQLVADHLQSRKRGGSLFMETGFPTSLIDLYVRNRGRFRKSSAKKQSSSSSGSFVDLNNLSSSGDSDCTETGEVIEEDVVVVGSKIEEDKSVELAKLSPVFVTMLKVLLIVVLVFGTKGFTIAITLSAFLLLFLEYMMKQLLMRSEQNATLVVELEIEEEVELKQEVRSEKESESESDEVRSEVLMGIRRKSSRRAIMKSKIKKIVSKNLRKCAMDSGHKICCEFEDVKPLVLSNECSDSKCEIIETGRRYLASTLSSESGCNDEELGRDLCQDSGCWILFMIVLVGLIGGRVVALVIALSWCLMVNMLQWRSVKFSIS